MTFIHQVMVNDRERHATLVARQTRTLLRNLTRGLWDFMATLHKNGMEEKKLSKYVTHRISDDHDVVTLSVSFPEEGQYGMDIYTRELRDDDLNCR